MNRALHFLRNSIQDVQSCPDPRDKVAVVTSSAGRVLTLAVNGLAQRIAHVEHDIVPNYLGMFRDVCVVNGDGVFRCRRRTSDYAIARYDYERALRQYFTLESGVFVDVGAHIGKYTVMVARQLADRGLVIAIEPEAGNFAALSKNVELNRLKNVRAINAACWDSCVELPLFLDACEPIKHSLTVRSKQSIPVSARPLDALLDAQGVRNVDLLKIDAEGADLRVLRGAAATLRRSPSLRIVLEGSEPEALELLKSHGFILKKTAHRFGNSGCYYVAEKSRRAS